MFGVTRPALEIRLPGENRNAALQRTPSLHKDYPTDRIGQLDRTEGVRLNKRKKVAWHKHLKKARKADEKRKAARRGAA